jgi:hypothetical protein
MRRSLLLVPVAGLALAVAAPQTGAAAPKRLRWDPPVLVSSEGRATREMSLVLNPRDERQMLACAPSGILTKQSPQSHFYRTANGGRTWSYTDVEPDSADPRRQTYEGGDCDVAYDAAGTAYVADTWIGNLSVGASRDGGRTWTGTPLAGTAPIVDRPWLAGGPPGTVYVTYQALQGQMPTLIWFTKTTDYGRTFSPAVPVTTANADGTYTWEGNLVAAPNGRDLYLIHTRRVTPAEPVAGLNDSIQLAHSHDGGLTWATRTVAPLPERPTPATLYPILALDGGGHLHATWSAPRTAKGDTPVYYTTSRDGGVTWTKPLAVNAGRHAWAPWVAGGRRAGEAALAWLDTPDDGASGDARWWFGYATIAGGRVTASGRTTDRPMWEGSQTNPEFEAVRIGRDGRLHLGMAVFREGVWALYYQRSR